MNPSVLVVALLVTVANATAAPPTVNRSHTPLGPVGRAGHPDRPPRASATRVQR
jgi:hypothetical protein